MSAVAATCQMLDYPCRGVLALGTVIFYVTTILVTCLENLRASIRSLRRFWHIVQHDGSMLTETFVALFCLMPGVWLIAIPNSPHREWDDVLELMMPLWAYGIGFIAVGILIIYGLHFQSFWARRCGQGLAFMVWLFFLIFFGLLFRHLLILSTMPTICLMAARSWWYLGRMSGITTTGSD